MNKNIYLVLSILLLFSCDTSISKYDKGPQFIAIQPFGDTNENHVNTIKKAIEDFYGYDVTILEPQSLPDHIRLRSLNSYHAGEILSHLRESKADSFTKIIGVIEEEISTTVQPKNERFIVLAKSDRHGSAGIISTERIIESTNSPKQLNLILKKITIHEVGHTLGLDHCNSDDLCLLKDFKGSVSVLEKQANRFCEQCARKLGWRE